MKKLVKRIVSTLLVCAMLVTSGCGKESTKEEIVDISDPSSVVAYNIYDKDVYLDEVYVYFLSAVSWYAQYYNENYGYEFEDLLTEQLDSETTFDDAIRENVTTEVVFNKVARSKCEEYNLELNDEANAYIETQTATFIDTYQDIMTTLGISEEAVREVYTDYAYSDYALKDYLVKEVDTEVAAEDMNISIVYNMLFMTILTDEEGAIAYDESGNVESVTADEKEALYNQALELSQRAKAGEDVEALVAEYGIADKSQQYEFMAGSAVEEYEAVVSQMQNGDISDPIETEYGYYVVKMISLNDTELSEAKKQEVIDSRIASDYISQINEIAESLDYTTKSVVDQVDLLTLYQK